MKVPTLKRLEKSLKVAQRKLLKQVRLFTRVNGSRELIPCMEREGKPRRMVVFTRAGTRIMSSMAKVALFMLMVTFIMGIG